MIGVLVVSHGDFCRELLNSCAMVAGKMAQADYAALHPGDGPDAFQARMLETFRRLDTGEGVLILADLQGGTPYNQSVASIRALGLNAKVVAGVNLAMLMVVSLQRGTVTGLEALAELAVEAGRNGVGVPAEVDAMDDDMEFED